MNLKRKRLLNKARLYVIISPDPKRTKSVFDIAAEALDGGADIIQLRDKSSARSDITRQAVELKSICDSYEALLAINDYPAVALEAGADIVHIGQDDMSVSLAKKIVGPECLIGKSTHSIDQALLAVREEADYIGYGPIYSTPTKPDYPHVGLEKLKDICAQIRIPYFAIGGIDQHRLPEVMSEGVARVAVVRFVTDSRDVKKAASDLKFILNQGILERATNTVD
ncbi:MAG: thiamine-phosphate pyrophosphorylase [Candidatus Omnitrophota bacterium]|jgi:thiamine-phosphate pyrophosphorylase